MTAPEPLSLTLKEALAVLSELNRALAVHRYDDFPTDYVLMYESSGSRIGTFASWPDAVSAALGRPVVERDDTAELIEALAAARPYVKEHIDAAARLAVHTGVPVASTSLDLLDRIDAALARHRGER